MTTITVVKLEKVIIFYFKSTNIIFADLIYIFLNTQFPVDLMKEFSGLRLS